MTALLALSLLAACALLPILGHMAVTMRSPRPEQVRASQNAKLAAATLAFDDLNAHARSIHARMYADGLIPDRRKTPRGAA